MNGKLRPEEIVAFAKNPKAFQQRFSEQIFDLVSQPLPIKYKLSELFKWYLSKVYYYIVIYYREIFWVPFLDTVPS